MQVEIDFKAECNAGDTVESLGSRTEPPAGGNGAAARRHYLHMLQACFLSLIQIDLTITLKATLPSAQTLILTLP